MRKRKHPRPNQRRNKKYQPTRRRKVLMNFAIVMVILMATSLIGASFMRRAEAPTDLKAAKTTKLPARLPANTTIPGE